MSESDPARWKDTTAEPSSPVGGVSPAPSGDVPGSHASRPVPQPLASVDQSAVSPPFPVHIEDDKTVISKKPPLGDAAPLLRAVTPAEMGKLLVGSRLGHFELEEFVGGGGMGAVFRATDTMLGRTVAVKVLSRDQTDEETIKRFKNEALNAARLDHERIARVYFVNEEDGWHYIVFEYIDGVNIRDLVDNKGPLALDEAIYYTLQVAEALRHAYRRDVVHRDIKPSNILVLNDGRVKLVDMGLARHHHVDPQDDLTASGVTLGTFDYISPEQARDPRNADVRSDIYSLGCTLYFMLTGRPPFPDGTVLQKLLSHSSDAPPDPRLYRPDVPDDICRIVAKTLAKNPAQRYATPDMLIAELLMVADRLGLETAAHGAVWVNRASLQPAGYQQHLPWIAPVVVLVLAVFLLDWFSGTPAQSLAIPQPTLLPPQRAVAPQTPTAGVGDNERATELKPATDKSNSNARPAQSPATTGSQNASSPNSPDKLPTAPAATDTAQANTEANDDWPNDITGAATEPLASAGIAEPATSAGIDAASPPSPATAVKPAAIRTLVVGSPGAALAPNAKAVATLAAACRQAADYPDLETIELNFDGPRVEEPLAISVSTLTIRAAAGRTPVVVFRPGEDTLADDRRMIRIAGGRVTIQGVQFRLELPKQVVDDGWALFTLHRALSLELERCGLTIRNVGDSGSASHENVAFIEFQAPAVAETTRVAEERVPLVPPLVQLSNTIARGEATFVRAATPYTMQWRQGLLITNQRLADIGGATSAINTLVQMQFWNVTLAVREGLCLMRTSDDAPRHMALQIGATDCIFLADEDQPLLEYRTLESIDRLRSERHPDFKGRGNIYSGTQEFWRIVSQRVNETEPTVSLPLDPDAGDKYGFDESLLLTSVMWKSLPAVSRPVHMQSKADYLLSGDPANPARRIGSENAGFSAASLPEFVSESRPDPANTTPSPPPMSAPTPGAGDKGMMPSSLPETMMRPVVPMIKPKPGEE